MLKKKLSILFAFLTILVVVNLITTQPNINKDPLSDISGNVIDERNIETKVELPKSSGAWTLPYIHVKNNWTETANEMWCSGTGFPWDPFIIENVTIDVTSSPLGVGILIENSNYYRFIIRNCTVYNWDDTNYESGILLINTSFGLIESCNITNCRYMGIGILGSNIGSHNNTISNNTISEGGILIAGGAPIILESYNNSLSDNNLTHCGIDIIGIKKEHLSNKIDTTNLVNKKPVYYYVEKEYLEPNDFSNAGQVLLFYCNHSQISNVNTSLGGTGIYVLSCLNITISNCNSSFNRYNGMNLLYSDNSSVINCRMIENGDSGIRLKYSDYCNFSLNYYRCDSIGIDLYDSDNTTIKNNTMVECGFFISGYTFPNYSIDTSNTVNGKPVYYYKEKNYLGSSNFPNPGQIILDNCNNSVISNYNVSKGSYGILIYVSQNVSIINNNASYCKKTGIHIYSSNNITLAYNDANYCEVGIKFEYGQDNNISYNCASYNDKIGFYLSGITETIFNKNNITFNKNNDDAPGGLYLDSCTDVNITNSIIHNNTLRGIYLYGSTALILEYNTITNNTDGIVFGSSSNTVKSNIISNNSRYGIYIKEDFALNNKIYNNTFSDNKVKNAYDTHGNTQWDDGISLGNSWDDYFGKDAGDDGRGDTAYIINGFPLAQDQYPIYWDAPVFWIIEPSPYQLCGNNSPSFSIIIIEGINDTTWYTLSDDSSIYNFTGTSSGKINQMGWNNLDNGTVIIHFYVNDSRGYTSYQIMTVFKDSIAPNITIIKPGYINVFNATAPMYNLTFIDAHLNDTWYRLWNGTDWSINYTIPGIGSKRTGQIDQNAWDDCPNGTIIIEFYANDTLSNLRMNSTTVRKDILGPLITINDPTPNELFSSTAPGLGDCNVKFQDVSSIDAKWYMLINGTDSSDYTNNYTWNDFVDQFVWEYMDNGTVIIKIFANDSLGYIGDAQVTVRKDIESPSIFIIEPALNDIFGNNTFNFTISVSGKDFDTLWYMLINGTNSNDYTDNRTYSDAIIAGIYEDPINYTLWNQFENGTVIIRFFLNRTNGLMVSNEVLVRKDIILPNITIILPVVNQSVSRSPPNFIVSIEEPNIHIKWYRLFNGTDYSKNYTFTVDTTINKTAWEAMWDSIKIGENITIIFYCNDTAGNLGFANVTVIKQVLQAAPPGGGADDDDGGKKAKKEEFDIVEFITNPVGLVVTGGSAGCVITISIIIRKRISVRKKIKEIERIERIRKGR